MRMKHESFHELRTTNLQNNCYNYTLILFVLVLSKLFGKTVLRWFKTIIQNLKNIFASAQAQAIDKNIRNLVKKVISKNSKWY